MVVIGRPCIACSSMTGSNHQRKGGSGVTQAHSAAMGSDTGVRRGGHTSQCQCAKEMFTNANLVRRGEPFDTWPAQLGNPEVELDLLVLNRRPHNYILMYHPNCRIRTMNLPTYISITLSPLQECIHTYSRPLISYLPITRPAVLKQSNPYIHVYISLCPLLKKRTVRWEKRLWRIPALPRPWIQGRFCWDPLSTYARSAAQ